ncbi:MAG: hypothetical protein V2A73_09865 [Pseudomonadota bacterium]
MVQPQKRPATLCGRINLAGLACLVVLAGFAGVGCWRKTSPRKREPPSVQLYTEPGVVTALAAAPPYVLVGTTRGLDCIDQRGGATVRFGTAEGLPTESVKALAPAVSTGGFWIGTERGVVYLDPETRAVLPIPGPPPEHAEALAWVEAMASSPDGGVFLGGSNGLYKVEPTWEWVKTAFAAPVTALLAGASGDLWIGSTSGAAVRHRDGTVVPIPRSDSFGLASVAHIIEAPDGTPVLIGESAGDDGQPRLAIQLGGQFATFRPSPAVTVLGAARVLDGIALLTSDRLFMLSVARADTAPGWRQAMQLLPESTWLRVSPWEARAVDFEIPPLPTKMTACGGEILIGTRAVGTVSLDPAASGKQRPRWLRRWGLVGTAVSLSVACGAPADCYLATGAAGALRYDGSTIVPLPPSAGGAGDEAFILAVAKSSDGTIWALSRKADDQNLHIAKLEEDGVFEESAAMALPVPVTAFSFAKFARDGTLWLGLQAPDEEEPGEMRSLGVAALQPGLGLLSLHPKIGTSEGNGPESPGVLPIPGEVTDVAFMDDNDEVWFATTSGAVRVLGGSVTVFGETEGLNSEILHSVVVTPGGMVFVASSRGVGMFDGESWQFPRELALRARAMAVGADGHLWIGTEHGLAFYDGRKLERIRPRAGLLAEEVADLTVDSYGRIWVRSRQGITVVVP